MTYSTNIETKIDPVAEKLRVSEAGVGLSINTAKDIERVAWAVSQDSSVIDLTRADMQPEDIAQAEQLSTALRGARAGVMSRERMEVPLSIDDIRLACRGAEAVLKGYKDRRERHFEDKNIPLEPQTPLQRLRKLGGEIVASVFVMAGNLSKSGRSARRLAKNVCNEQIELWQEKSDYLASRQNRTTKLSYTKPLDPWSIRANSQKSHDKAPEERDPIVY